jgi:hypothetical protein
MTHADIPPARLQIVSFPAGHSPFEGEENQPRFTEVVRKFVIAHGGEGRF